MKQTYEIEYPDDHGKHWMNEDNLMACLCAYCKNTPFKVKEITEALAIEDYSVVAIAINAFKHMK